MRGSSLARSSSERNRPLARPSRSCQPGRLVGRRSSRSGRAPPVRSRRSYRSRAATPGGGPAVGVAIGVAVGRRRPSGRSGVGRDHRPSTSSRPRSRIDGTRGHHRSRRSGRGRTGRRSRPGRHRSDQNRPGRSGRATVTSRVGRATPVGSTRATAIATGVVRTAAVGPPQEPGHCRGGRNPPGRTGVGCGRTGRWSYPDRRRSGRSCPGHSGVTAVAAENWAGHGRTGRRSAPVTAGAVRVVPAWAAITLRVVGPVTVEPAAGATPLTSGAVGAVPVVPGVGRGHRSSSRAGRGRTGSSCPVAARVVRTAAVEAAGSVRSPPARSDPRWLPGRSEPSRSYRRAPPRSAPERSEPSRSNRRGPRSAPRPVSSRSERPVPR